MKTWRVVVASPSDVQAERDSLPGVVDTVNRHLEALGLQIVMEVRRAETDVPAGVHVDGPQGQADEFLRPEESDVLIGIFWKRFGTPVKDAQSGSEHEIRRAYDAWKKHRKPQVMLYFNQASCTLKTREEADQVRRVLEFKTEFGDKVWYKEYSGAEEFAKLVERDLKVHAFTSAADEGVEAAPLAGRKPVVSCFATTEPRIVRGEGRTELLGDIVLTFERHTRAREDGVERFDVRTILTANVTNRLVGDSLTDAVLFVGGDIPEVPEARDFLRGRKTHDNALLFDNVPVDLTGGAGSVRITNLRGNSSQAFALVQAAEFGTISALVQVQPAAGRVAPVGVHGGLLSVGLIQGGFGFDVRTKDDGEGAPFAFSRSRGVNAELAAGSSSGSICFNIRFREACANAFKTRNEEAGSLGVDAARPTTGTRLIARFAGIPENVRVFVTTTNVSCGTTRPRRGGGSVKAVLVSRDDSCGYSPGEAELNFNLKGTRTLGHGFPIVELGVWGGSSAATWEWVSDDPDSPTTIEDVSFGVALAAKPDEAGLCDFPPCVSGNLAPISSKDRASPDAPIPRFADLPFSVVAFSVVP